jgi:hypothetical protein
MTDINEAAQIINEAFHQAALEAALLESHHEVEFLKKCTDLARDQFNEKNTNKNIRIKTGYIHQKPYAIFIDPKDIAEKSRTELGDLLIVVKRKKANLIEREATFIQVKWDSSKPPPYPSWKIEPHQRDFWKNIKTNKFSFGKKARKAGGYDDIVFDGIKEDGNLCRYLFVNPYFLNKQSAWLIDLDLIKDKDKYETKDFLLNFQSMFENKLKDILNGAGVKVKNKLPEVPGVGGSLSDILTIIYKYLGWQEDPPEEFESYFEGDEGFMVLEITVLDKE